MVGTSAFALLHSHFVSLADQLKKALVTYTESGGPGNPTFDTAQAIAVMLEKHGIACDLMHGFNWDKWTSTATQAALAGDGMDGTEGTKLPAASKATAKLAWPKTFAEQALAVRAALTAFAAPAFAATLAKTFKSAKADRISDLLETLTSLGQARALPGEKYVAA